LTSWSVVGAIVVNIGLGGWQDAAARSCVVTGPRYHFNSEVVEWSVTIGSGESCIQGFRFGDIVIESVKLIVPPRSGTVKMEGSGFSYTARSHFEGEDSFAVVVSGVLSGRHGSSTVRVSIFVGGVLPAPANSRWPHELSGAHRFGYLLRGYNDCT